MSENEMSNCCAVPAPTASATLCPASGTKSQPAKLETVKALLTSEALQRLTTSPHRFCSEPTCEVVYFNACGQTYLKSDIRVAVWQKEPSGVGIVCYCFGENEADIRAEMDLLGKSGAVARVRAHIHAGRCACEVRNPRGVCCLGDVTAVVGRIAAERASAELSRQDGSVPW